MAHAYIVIEHPNELAATNSSSVSLCSTLSKAISMVMSIKPEAKPFPVIPGASHDDTERMYVTEHYDYEIRKITIDSDSWMFI